MELILMGGAYVYIMTNKPMGTLYIGVTADLPARIFMHRSGTSSDFCKKWDLTRLVYAEHSIGSTKLSSAKKL